MNHSEVVKTLKELPKSFRLVCSRNSEHVPIQVIDTAQEKSAFAARVCCFLILTYFLFFDLLNTYLVEDPIKNES